MIRNIKFLSLLLVFGCGEQEIIQIPLQGSLEGIVIGYGLEPIEGVTITIEGKDPLIVRTSDSNGKFTVDDLETGTYNLVYTKPGYGTFKMLGYSFVGGSIPAKLNTLMVELPNVNIVGFNAQIEIDSYFGDAALNGSVLIEHLEQEYEEGHFRYYISNSPDVSPTQFKVTGLLDYYFSDVSSYDFSLPIKNLFPSGSTLYMVVYPVRGYEDYSYMDLSTGKQLFPAMNPQGSEVLSFLVP
ncbi:MAG TPA: carboxypeptidase regulatory-like domain-containing protein [Ohtaekwangia sp.]|nr:carboxypeptidase regulatory-like domain-containing protein [Ohtaekwangia sp.]